MKTMSGGYLSHLAGELQQRALCVRVTRADGTVMGFTSFDDNLTVGGVEYEAAFAVEISDLRASAGTGVDNAEVLGALVSSRITDTDILAGLYDGAEFSFFEVIWSDTSLGSMIYAEGSLGEFTMEMPGRYRSELRSHSQRLQQNIVEMFQASCQVKQLGDHRCKVDLAAFQSSHGVASVTSLTVVTFASNSEATGYYRSGRVEFTSGANDGFDMEIKEHVLSGGQAVITLQQAFPFEVEVGDTAILEAGCDRRLLTCENVFDNTINHRGFPFLPGTESILVRGRR